MMNHPELDSEYTSCLDDCLRLASYVSGSQIRQESQISFISGVLF